jgi:signal transduction histidine kinase
MTDTPNEAVGPDASLRLLRHDLANPLSAVLAETQLLLLNEDALDAETVESLREIERLARQMREILQRDW